MKGAILLAAAVTIFVSGPIARAQTLSTQECTEPHERGRQALEVG
jgi:hypothetical protein